MLTNYTINNHRQIYKCLALVHTCILFSFLRFQGIISYKKMSTNEKKSICLFSLVQRDRNINSFLNINTSKFDNRSYVKSYTIRPTTFSRLVKYCVRLFRALVISKLLQDKIYSHPCLPYCSRTFFLKS